LFDPKLDQNPKTYREASLQMMFFHGTKYNPMNHLWCCGLPQFMVPYVQPYSDLVDGCTRNFDAETRIIRGKRIKVKINGFVVHDML
jgi:hypothetical protein